MEPRKKYIARSKVSNAKFREFLKLFALDLTAAQITKATGVNRNTVNRFARLVRARIAEECERATPLRGTVEVDESYFGPRRVRGKRGRGAVRKTIVLRGVETQQQGVHQNHPQCHQDDFNKDYQDESTFRKHDPF